MPTLKTKKVNAVICWNSLRNVPPREFTNIPEMEKTGEILATLEEEIPTFVAIIKEGEELNDKISAGSIAGEEVAKTKNEWASRSRLLENSEKGKEIEIEFENENFNTFFQQFERWGKNWFTNIAEYLAFRKDMTDANSRPGAKK